MRQIKYRLIFGVVAAVFSAGAVTSCIVDDVPPPEVKGIFVEFEAEGETRPASINLLNRTVSVDLEETVDLRSVKLLNVELSETGVCEIGTGSVVDLSSPLKVTIKTQAEYVWTITATQTIERRFAIADQVDETIFEEHSRSVFAYVPKGTDITQIDILELKLGPEGQTTMDPDLSGIVSFRKISPDDKTAVREVKVSYRDVKDQVWSLYVSEAGTGMRSINRGDVWASFVTVNATVLEAQDPSTIRFGYRRAGETVWQYATATAGASYGYSAKITGLVPSTAYEASISVDGAFVGEPYGFTTESAAQPINPGFEEHGYSNAAGNKIGYYFYSDIANKFWDCGNKGAMTLNANVTTPAQDPRPGSTGTYSAQLKSAYPNALGIGKFAAGNMYSGDYAGTRGTNGYINFGREFTSRPSSLSVWYKAAVGTVDYSGGGGLVKGDTDKYRILVALTDWEGKGNYDSAYADIPADGQRQIYTGDANTFIDWYTDPGIIAYGEHVSSAAVSGWTKLTFDLKYRSLTRIPTRIVIVASASMLGDYFTGSTSSWMCLDDFELVYNDNIVSQ